jgi:hypothetical protein
MYFLSDCGGLYGSQDWCCWLRGSVAPLNDADMGGLEAGGDGS